MKKSKPASGGPVAIWKGRSKDGLRDVATSIVPLRRPKVGVVGPRLLQLGLELDDNGSVLDGTSARLFLQKCVAQR
jgi:hypothetical protein